MVLLSFYYTHKPGGLNLRLYRALRALAAAGHKVHYASLDEAPKDALTGVEFHRIWFPWKVRSGLLFWCLFTFWLPFWLLGCVARIHPQRLIAFGAVYSFLALPASRWCRVPIVLFMRSLVFKNNALNKKPEVESRLSDALERMGLQEALKVVVMSRAMERDLQIFLKEPLRQVSVLPNEVSTSSVVGHAMHRRPLRVFASGVLDARKNMSVLLDAAVALPPGLIQLTIAGAGPQLDTLRAKASGRTDIRFTGWIENTSEELSNTDLVVHPALHEGVSNSVLEALGMNVPVLVSDIPEHAEFFPVSASRFNPRDASVLAAILERLATDPTAYRLLVEASSQTTTQLTFNWDKALVESVLG